MAQPNVQPQALAAAPALLPNTRHPHQDAADAIDEEARQDVNEHLTRRMIKHEQQLKYFLCSNCHLRRALRRRAGTDNQGRPQCCYCRDLTPLQSQQKWCDGFHEAPRSNFVNLDHIERETCLVHWPNNNHFTCRNCNIIRRDRHSTAQLRRFCVWCTNEVQSAPLAYCNYADHVMFDTEFRPMTNPTALSRQCRRCEAIDIQVNQDRVQRNNNITNAHNQKRTRDRLTGNRPSGPEATAACLRFAARQSNLMNTPMGHTGLNTQAGLWRGVRNLGQGSFGCTALYVQERGGRVVDRVVVKSERADDTNNWGWSDNSWVLSLARGLLNGLIPGNGQAQADQTRIVLESREAYLTRLLRQTNYNVKYRGFHQIQGQSPHIGHRSARARVQKMGIERRLYLGYAEHGNLHDITNEYILHGQIIPELAVWYIFQCLANAAEEMTGVRSGWDEASEDEQIVHQDLNPNNVLVTENTHLPMETQDTHPEKHIFQRFIVSDFGSARLTSSDDLTNPAAFMDDATTRSFQPMELFKAWLPPLPNMPDIRPTPVPQRLSSANIYQIGTTILQVMLLEPSNQANFNYLPDRDIFAFWSRHLRLDVRAWLRQHYSKKLIDLVERCLAYEPDDRIGCEELLRCITAHLKNRKNLPVLRANAHRHHTNRSAHTQAQLRAQGIKIREYVKLRHVPRDRYRIGFAANT